VTVLELNHRIGELERTMGENFTKVQDQQAAMLKILRGSTAQVMIGMSPTRFRVWTLALSFAMSVIVGSLAGAAGAAVIHYGDPETRGMHK
jgi:hypothetical protein